MSLDERRGVFVVTGIQASGKSTVGRLLAERFDRSAFIDGDTLWKLVVSGREDMTADPTDEAIRQLHLRYANGVALADRMFEAGFTAVFADNIYGADLERVLSWVGARSRYLVVLNPSTEAVVARERARGTSAYRDWPGSLNDAVEEFQRYLDATPRVGLWIDTSEQAPEETVEVIMDRVWDEGRVDSST